MDEFEQISILGAYAENAVETLKQMTGEKHVFPAEDDPYWKWKKSFQKLTLHGMGNIYKRYFGDGN